MHTNHRKIFQANSDISFLMFVVWSFFFHQVLDNCIEAKKIVDRYEALASDLLDWIEKTIAVISNQKFANSLTGVQQQLQAFTTYCTIEKPIKYVHCFNNLKDMKTHSCTFYRCVLIALFAVNILWAALQTAANRWGEVVTSTHKQFPVSCPGFRRKGTSKSFFLPSKANSEPITRNLTCLMMGSSSQTSTRSPTHQPGRIKYSTLFSWWC